MACHRGLGAGPEVVEWACEPLAVRCLRRPGRHHQKRGQLQPERRPQRRGPQQQEPLQPAQPVRAPRRRRGSAPALGPELQERALAQPAPEQELRPLLGLGLEPEWAQVLVPQGPAPVEQAREPEQLRRVPRRP